MKAKVLAVISVITVIALLTTGCFSSVNEEENTKIPEGVSAEETEKEEEKEEAKETIEETVCFEYEGLKVTAKELFDDSLWGKSIKFLIENNSDKAFSVSARQVIINNAMTSAGFTESVAAGKKANKDMQLEFGGLKAAGIENIGQIEIYFAVSDADSYKTLYESEAVTIKTSSFDNMDTTPDETGKEIYNADGIRVVAKYVDEKSFWGQSVVLYIENKSEKNISIRCEDLSVNGYMITDYFYEDVFAGKYSVDEICLSATDLKDNGITDIEEIEFRFKIKNPETLDVIAESEPILLTF